MTGDRAFEDWFLLEHRRAYQADSPTDRAFKKCFEAGRAIERVESVRLCRNLHGILQEMAFTVMHHRPKRAEILMTAGTGANACAERIERQPL